MILFLVLLLERILCSIMTKFTTSEELDLRDVLILPPLLLLPLGCKGYIFFLLLGLHPIVVVAINFALD